MDTKRVGHTGVVWHSSRVDTTSSLGYEPTIDKITKIRGVAGSFGFQVDVTYPDESTSRVTFIGNDYGPLGQPIVMITPGNPGGSFVTDPGRFGKFSEEWVRRFFS